MISPGPTDCSQDPKCELPTCDENNPQNLAEFYSHNIGCIKNELIKTKTIILSHDNIPKVDIQNQIDSLTGIKEILPRMIENYIQKFLIGKDTVSINLTDLKNQIISSPNEINNLITFYTTVKSKTQVKLTEAESTEYQNLNQRINDLFQNLETEFNDLKNRFSLNPTNDITSSAPAPGPAPNDLLNPGLLMGEAPAPGPAPNDLLNPGLLMAQASAPAPGPAPNDLLNPGLLMAQASAPAPNDLLNPGLLMGQASAPAPNDLLNPGLPMGEVPAPGPAPNDLLNPGLSMGEVPAPGPAPNDLLNPGLPMGEVPAPGPGPSISTEVDHTSYGLLHGNLTHKLERLIATQLGVQVQPTFREELGKLIVFIKSIDYSSLNDNKKLNLERMVQKEVHDFLLLKFRNTGDTKFQVDLSRINVVAMSGSTYIVIQIMPKTVKHALSNTDKEMLEFYNFMSVLQRGQVPIRENDYLHYHYPFNN